MEFKFTIKTQKADLIINKEYPLFWQSHKNQALFDNVGTCKVQLGDDQVDCSATITTGGVQHSINDTITAEFKASDVLANKYEYAILFKDDFDGNEYVYGFCLC